MFGGSYQFRSDIESGNLNARFQVTLFGFSARYTSDENGLTIDFGAGFIVGIGAGANGFAGVGYDFSDAGGR